MINNNSKTCNVNILLLREENLDNDSVHYLI